jgi:cell division protein FtsN
MLTLFSKDSGQSTGNNRQQLLLLVLLLIVAAGAYVYFFTGLIVPRDQGAKKPPAPAAPVKKPMPPRPEESAAKPAQPAKEEAKPAPAVPAKQEAAAKPATPPEAKPAQPPAKPAPAKPAPPAAAAPKEAAKAAAKPAPQPVKPEVKTAAKPAVQPAKPEAKAVVKPVAKKGAPPTKAAEGTFTLLVGEVAHDESLKLKARLTKLGYGPVTLHHVKRMAPMNRLFVMEAALRDEADEELQKLKKFTADAFVLPHNSTYSVFAGSYYSAQRAAAEKDRLGRQGFRVTLQKADLPITLTRVTVSGSGDAEAAVTKLKKHGIRAKVLTTK